MFTDEELKELDGLPGAEEEEEEDEASVSGLWGLWGAGLSRGGFLGLRFRSQTTGLSDVSDYRAE